MIVQEEEEEADSAKMVVSVELRVGAVESHCDCCCLRSRLTPPLRLLEIVPPYTSSGLEVSVSPWLELGFRARRLRRELCVSAVAFAGGKRPWRDALDKKHQEPVATSFGGRLNASKRVIKPGYLPWNTAF